MGFTRQLRRVEVGYPHKPLVGTLIKRRPPPLSAAEAKRAQAVGCLPWIAIESSGCGSSVVRCVDVLCGTASAKENKVHVALSGSTHQLLLMLPCVQVPILCQNENGPCPLLAIGNVLLLQSNISIHPVSLLCKYSLLFTCPKYRSNIAGGLRQLSPQPPLRDVADWLSYSLSSGWSIRLFWAKTWENNFSNVNIRHPFLGGKSITR